MAKRETLKPGELPNIFDTDPPPMHEATLISEGYVGIDEAKLTKAEREEVLHRYPAPNIYHAPQHEPEHERHDERHTATRTTTVSVSRTTTR